MYVPAWQLLSPRYFFRAARRCGRPFPLDAPNRTSFYVARSGIYHLIRALGFDRGATVLMPDYHSGVEVWAVRAAGARVEYYHVDRNMEPDLNEIEDLCRSNPRAIYMIHYLGWPQPVKEMREICRRRGLILIEDCALSFLSELDGQPLGTFGDYAVFCLYKTLPVPNGGILVQNGAPLDALADLETKPCDKLSVMARSAELMLDWLQTRSEFIGQALRLAKGAAGKALTALGRERLPVADITPEFQSAGYHVEKLNVGLSSLSAALLDRFDYESIRQTRRDNYSRLHELLAGKVPSLPRELEDGVCPLFFPLLVSEKHSAAQALWRQGIRAVEFWNYGYPEADEHTAPDARFLRDHALELPIHQDITPAQIEHMAEQVVKLPYSRFAREEFNRSRARGRRALLRSVS
ncbi:MAG TPA: aminotransferase class V-fold PLP-dependent enzyme [Candidatus Binatia bacterium]|jgi:dTDP-4-amino-4,6-dideoxygalactose transaminase